MNDDLISRQAVLSKQVYMETEEGWSGFVVDVKHIEELSSVTPKQRTGHWKEEYIGAPYDVCSECGHRILRGYFKYNYCPNCDAKMESEGVE